MSLEKYLVEHCSPTLASLKTANMFSCSYDSEESLDNAICLCNQMLEDKGIELILLRCENGLALIYVCRKERLKKDLSKEGVEAFLSQYGYQSTDVNYAINMLKKRLDGFSEFPHEIGLFLDYPLGDVKGFIDNSGANCKCTGCWKVYCNECEAVKLFDKYKKCREVYSRLWNNGSRTLSQLAVKQY